MDSAGIGSLTEQALLLHLVDLVLAVSLLELLWLLLRRPAAMAQLLPNLLAGLSLVLALRLGLGGAGLAWVAPCLAAAGLAHLLDLRARRQPAGQRSGPSDPTVHPTTHPAAQPTTQPPNQPPNQPTFRPRPPAAPAAPRSSQAGVVPPRLPTVPHQSPR